MDEWVLSTSGDRAIRVDLKITEFVDSWCNSLLHPNTTPAWKCVGSAKDAYPKDGMYLSGFAAISCAQAQNCGRLHRAFRCFATRTFRWLIMIRSFRYLNETFVIVHISDLLYAYMSKSAVCEETIRYMNCMDLDRSLRLHAVCQSPGASMRWAR